MKLCNSIGPNPRGLRIFMADRGSAMRPEERAKTRMWTRRIARNILKPTANGFMARG